MRLLTEDYLPLTLGDGSVAVGSVAVGSGERHFQRLQGRFEFDEGPSGTRNFDTKVDEF